MSKHLKIESVSIVRTPIKARRVEPVFAMDDLVDLNRGRKQLEHASHGGHSRGEQIADAHGGRFLRDAIPQLRKALADLQRNGHSKSNACRILARDKAKCPWSAEYLRKRL